ncbi:hypothetical protein JM78_35290 [Burkholderia pyrrocinia]|nr:hypothetical protein JM78_35290 [Burkholderia pyrrocinia]
MYVLTLILAQEEIAEGRAAILLSVVVIPRAAASHESDVTGGKYSGQSKLARPISHCLHAVRVVRPARSCSCQR